ncbi:MAG: hypothetical protein IKR69_03005 [Bacteroidales bacterium]|nr:hypothetical protein [Bacteroidales bacterium]
MVVTSADPSAFSSLEGFFDIVVADVPCSGEGMFRKEPDAVRDWSPETVKLCASRQRRIIADVWPALRPGGLMIYSTCTFNHFENGDNVRWIAEELGAEILSPASCAGVVKTAEGLSLVPGLVRGEGQFVAALEKCPGAAERRCRPGGIYRGSMPPETALSLSSHAHRCRPGGIYRGSMPPETASVLAFTASFSLRGDTLIAVPAAIEKEVQELGSLHPMSTGVAIGTLKGDTLVPSADLALSTGLRAGAFPRFNLSEEEAVRFLRRDSILTPGAPNGYVLVCFRDTPLGFVKNLGNRCNNLHPASRRILQR